MLTQSEIEQYTRQLILPEVGTAGQERLREASVLLVGAGGLGSPGALYLAAAGVGRIGLIDPDVVSVSNLHRQVLYTTTEVGTPKVEAAAQRLRAMNPHIEVQAWREALTTENAPERLAGVDLVLDGTDTFATRYLVNDACVRAGVPNVFASVTQFEGQASIFGAPDGPCYRCLFPEPPPLGLIPSCAEGGVLGVLPGLMGIIQATQALTWLLGIGEPLVGRLLMADARTLRFRELAVERDPDCPVCGGSASRDRSTVAVPLETCAPELSVQDLRDRFTRGAPVVLDVRTPEEVAHGHLEGLHIPLGDLDRRLDELAPYRASDLVVVCRSGARSAAAVALLRSAGFDGALNLRGGLQAWSREINPAFVCA